MANATDIVQWLNSGCDYEHGVTLYEELGTNAFLKLVFKRGFTELNAQRLRTELTAVAQLGAQLVTEQVVQQVVQADEPSAHILDDIDINALSDEFRERVFVLRPKTYREAASIHNRLFDATEAERQELVPQMMQLMYTNAAIWRDIEYYKRTGLEPKDEQASPGEVQLQDLTYQELSCFINSLAPKISRWRAALKKLPEGDERNELSARIAKEYVTLTRARELFKQ